MNVAALLHAGWFNVALAALAIWAVVRTYRRPFVALGIAAIAFAVVANGLLGPDTQTVVGAPGTSVRVDGAGTLVFPPLQQADTMSRVQLRLGALLRSVPRTVVAIDARDARGAHLTITQPTGAAFLSPVLLMQQKQHIAGLDVPYDEFAVPAAHRIVKTVLLAGAQAAVLPRVAALGGNAVLFDLEDETGTSLPHGIGVTASGEQISLGGLRLRPVVRLYPAVVVYAIPNLAVVAAGLLSLIAGLLLTRRKAPG